VSGDIVSTVGFLGISGKGEEVGNRNLGGFLSVLDEVGLGSYAHVGQVREGLVGVLFHVVGVFGDRHTLVPLEALTEGIVEQRNRNLFGGDFERQAVGLDGLVFPHSGVGEDRGHGAGGGQGVVVNGAAAVLNVEAGPVGGAGEGEVINGSNGVGRALSRLSGGGDVAGRDSS